jgi:CheY-like chemotaxis protein
VSSLSADRGPTRKGCSTLELRSLPAFRIFLDIIAKCFAPIENRPVTGNEHYRSLYRQDDTLHTSGFSNITIVIVEDDADTRSSLTRFLHRQGAAVFTAANASEGLQAVKEYHPNIVLSDINLPSRDGFELLGDIRALGTEHGGATPIIAMTAISGLADPNHMIAAGFQGQLKKPFRPEQLIEEIKLVLRD